MNKQESVQQNQPDPQRELDSGSDAMLSDHAAQKPHFLVWIVLALLLVFLALGTYFLFKPNFRQTGPVGDDIVSPTMPADFRSQPSDIPSPTSDLSVPTISKDNSLETIRQELEEINPASPDSELNNLEQETSDL